MAAAQPASMPSQRKVLLKVIILGDSGCVLARPCRALLGFCFLWKEEGGPLGGSTAGGPSRERRWCRGTAEGKEAPCLS